MDITTLLQDISRLILNPLIGLAFAVAFAVFFWGILQFISSQTTDTGRNEGKRKIFWGLFGMFIMISTYGLIRLILDIFGITGPSYPGF